MDALSQDDAGDDWMTLNVWSPEPSSSARLPVMVWIQGGAYVIGMSGLPEYDGALGACHGLDVPLVFGNLDGGQTAALIGAAPSPEARTLSDRMRAAWASFADHGDPGWPAYDRESRLVQVFADRPVVSAYPEEASRWIWQDYDFPALPFAGP